jgi:queuine tRNA-ribosyltransferase accessory subunit
MQVVERSMRDQNKPAPILATPTNPDSELKPLHNFTATSSSILTVLGARRTDPVPSPQSNSNTAVGIFTSTGSQALTHAAYITAVDRIRPDVAISLADVATGSVGATTNAKRALRMSDRTETWLGEFVEAAQSRGKENEVAIFAPVLPLSGANQWDYLQALADEDMLRSISGLAIYSVDTLLDLDEYYPSLNHLPRLSLGAPATPHQILRQISLGVDILTIPFVNATSDAGIALTFSFPTDGDLSTQKTNGTTPTHLPLGFDLTPEAHATALTPLMPNCACHTCRNHHTAYIRHLLSAHEMLAWTLLQIHNHHIISAFLSDIRSTLSRGGAESFEAGARKFSEFYEPDLPVGAAERPRARGYNFKSVTGDEKRNKAAWGDLDGKVEKAGKPKGGAKRERMNKADELAVLAVSDEGVDMVTTETPQLVPDDTSAAVGVHEDAKPGQ